MDALFFILIFGGVIAMLVAWIWVVVMAFKDSFAWGLFSFILNPVALVYALTHTDDCKKPLIIFGSGLALYIISLVYWG